MVYPHQKWNICDAYSSKHKLFEILLILDDNDCYFSDCDQKENMSVPAQVANCSQLKTYLDKSRCLLSKEHTDHTQGLCYKGCS